jgi:hypothetical protein
MCEHGGHDQVSLQIHLEGMIKCHWMSTWRRSMEGVLGSETLFIT